MRVSTTQIFRNGIGAIQDNQQGLARTQLQLGTGKRILSPSDDPSGAVQALQFRSSVEKTEQYQRNGNIVEQRLRLSETILTSVGEGLQRVRELAVQGNNGSQTNETRRYIAGEIRQILDELVQLSNTRDANGEYIYAGLTSLTQPFSPGAGGEVFYNGDDGQRRLQISPVRQLAIGDSGQAVFMDIPTGNGTFVVRDDPGNTGGGVIDAGSVIDFNAWQADTYTISFSEVGGELFYEVSGGGLPPVSTPFVEGEAIRFAGIETRIQGTPADGDSFTLSPSENQDLFATYRQLAEALEAPVTDTPSRARLNNAVNRALVNLDQALGNILDTRASVGSRLKTVENQRNINEDVLLQLRTTLSEIEDLDYAEAISRFNLQQTALQAAQQSYVQVQRLSLFNFI
ncbi:flagellar hook-associated protein FlgL [Thioalkalivibrio sulfidiphilus]|uniref:Flagellar hook-associated protein 3 n=1 Tax=Thioalkalivibrio sulfidiphilus (strain HL-EbGR7) TaxID=396588 RepID=B8GQB8_THISH|nr:flagellar hook-associated protein FlgL [Thioalkalivibrio sulfidiphilus]ACL72313.1 flagellar hook-associated protein 3 [Thioalkalivibrio sulfidiphilus HL-EbGr7]